MSGHTPGPWFIARALEIHAADDRETIIARVMGSPSNPEALADARLIAAAPDLLAALVSVLEWIDNWSPQFVEDDEWAADEESAKAAIAKARGE